MSAPRSLRTQAYRVQLLPNYLQWMRHVVLACAGKENMFVFGVDAEDVPRLREERANFKDYDPRWVKVMDALLSGQFGDAEYFQVRPHAHINTDAAKISERSLLNMVPNSIPMAEPG